MSLVDIARIRETSGGDKEFERELVQLYLEDSFSNIAKLKTAYEKRDPKGLGEWAHGLKGSSASVGAIRLKEWAEALERAANQAEFEVIATLMGQIGGVYAETKAVFEEFLKTVDG